jgi:pimeloyl-ACP methyl ester carboxylesterase
LISAVVESCEAERADLVFGYVKKALVGHGFPCRSFVNYSYELRVGPRVENGLFYPAPYGVADTGAHPLPELVENLNRQLRGYAQRLMPGEPLEFVLVGHSLGGVIALDYAQKVMETRESGNAQDLPKVVAVVTINSPVLGVSREDYAHATGPFHFDRWAVSPVPQMRDFARLLKGETARGVLDRWENPSKENLAHRLATHGIRSFSIGNEHDCLWRPWACGIPRQWADDGEASGEWLFDWDLEAKTPQPGGTQLLPGSEGVPIGSGLPAAGLGPCAAWVQAPTDSASHLDASPVTGACIGNRHWAVMRDDPGNRVQEIAAWIHGVLTGP